MNYSVLLSPLFTFLIGDSQEHITVPSSLLDRLSPALGALINNGCMEESKNRVAVIENVSIDTFTAVCEFAYTGDYKAHSPPAQDIQGHNDRNIEAEECDVTGDDGISKSSIDADIWGGFSKKKKKIKNEEEGWKSTWDLGFQEDKPSTLWQGFQNLTFYTLPPRGPSKKLRQSELMFHALVYEFAEEKIIRSVQDCCLQHIHDGLLSLERGQCETRAFLELLHFAYDRRTRDSVFGEDRLRLLTSVPV